MGDFCITAEECVCSEHYGRADFIHDFGNNAVMQRRGVKKQLGAFQKRKKRADGQPEAVEHRQGVKHRVRNIDGFNGGHLLDV